MGGEDCSSGSCKPDPVNTLPFLIPVAGPFIALASEQVRTDRGMLFWGIASGAIQFGGATVFVIGPATAPKAPPPNKPLPLDKAPLTEKAPALDKQMSLRIVPMTSDRGGLSLIGQF